MKRTTAILILAFATLAHSQQAPTKGTLGPTIQLTKGEDLLLRAKYDDLLEVNRNLTKKAADFNAANKALVDKLNASNFPEWITVQGLQKDIRADQAKEDVAINEVKSAAAKMIETHHMTGKLWFDVRTDTFTSTKPAD